MITVMKASAGSGKTYALAKKYTDMLLASKDREEYRHILAVTFTNKATDEMKARIIKMLYEHEDPRARGILSDILHDYGSFAVSTIDKFFQQTLRAFARELGHFGNYQVELDKDALVDEAVDTILDELNQDDKDDCRMIDFIVESMEDNIAEGASLNIDVALKEMAKQLKSESFSHQSSLLGMQPDKAYSHERLKGLKKTCAAVIGRIETDLHAKGEAILAGIRDLGLTVADFSGGESKSWMKLADKAANWKKADGLNIYSPTAATNIQEPSEKWFASAKKGYFPAARAALEDKLRDLYAYLTDPARLEEYSTALILQDQVYGLGVAARLFRMFDRVAKERNVVCLDESNSVLKDIIDGSDTPFVYEKTGVFIRTFLLDEFQDTSITQWENFLPLLKESEAGKETGGHADHVFDNLIVGDVKQSIYRWRQSDWGLLDHEVERVFGKVYEDPLKSNWRSLEHIVSFNNALYPVLAKAIDGASVTPDGYRKLVDIYGDPDNADPESNGCYQSIGKPARQGGDGLVEVKFFNAEKKDEAEQAKMQDIVDTITDLRDNHNASLDDIAILVRTKKQGTRVAQELIRNNMNVVTSASLRVKNSVSVRRLVSMMSYVDNPDDAVGAFIARMYGMTAVPDAYHSLSDLVELLYGLLCSDQGGAADCENEVVYVTSFMDFVMDYARGNGNNLHDFLHAWAEADPTVNASGGGGAVKVVTIHASKGLAFPYVIVPYMETMRLYESTKTKAWASPKNRSAALEEYSDALYYVPLGSMAENSYFKDTLIEERFNQGVDIINLLYVATTRAMYGMKLMANVKHKSFSESIGKYVHNFCGQKDYCNGSLGDFEEYRRRFEDDTAEKVTDIALTNRFYDRDSRLSIRPYAADFFTEQDKELDKLSYRERGIVLHDILGCVKLPSDLEKAVDAAICDGSLAMSSRADVIAFLARRIASRQDFFPEDARVKILNETSIIGLDGREHRPDRVLIHPDGKVVIVDFKFGAPKDEYLAQIEGYKELFVQMGYKDVSAHLWFVYNNKLI